uniref:Uncharacterized protein n=1 Tax=Setaria digitata TaxID=48799 RepID=A0A915Q5N2_9BILA
MAIEFSENEFEDEMEPENTEVLQYETFLLYARSENPPDREIAIRNLSRLLGIMSIEKKQRQIEVIFSLIENVFAKERDSKLCALLVEQVPLLYIEFMALEYLLKKVHKVFPLLLANSLEHTADDVSDQIELAVCIVLFRCKSSSSKKHQQHQHKNSLAERDESIGIDFVAEELALHQPLFSKMLEGPRRR